MNDRYETDPAILLERIFLHPENPRFDPVDTEREAIEKLCQKEGVLPLARDIVKMEVLNPMEFVGLIRNDKSKGRRQTFLVVEGNRRVCALKLLTDPELAPSNLKSKFVELSSQWEPVTTLPAIIFGSLDEAAPWIQRLHSGYAEGIGRKSWDPTQNARFSGASRNSAALSFLDYCESRNLISQEDRKNKITTVQRFIGNAVFKENIGLERTDPTNPLRNRPQEEFDKIAKLFIDDLKAGERVNSRMNSKEIEPYARELISRAKPSGERVEPETLEPTPTKKKGSKRRARAQAPKKPEKISFSGDIHDRLKTLDNAKLKSLYHSIYSVELEHHTPILSIGVWAFFESLTACAGCGEKDSFQSFLNKQRLGNYGIASREEKTSLAQAIARIHGYGNSTKHRKVAATFDREQLNNDMEALEVVIVKCIEEAIGKK